MLAWDQNDHATYPDRSNISGRRNPISSKSIAISAEKREIQPMSNTLCGKGVLEYNISSQVVFASSCLWELHRPQVCWALFSWKCRNVLLPRNGHCLACKTRPDKIPGARSFLSWCFVSCFISVQMLLCSSFGCSIHDIDNIIEHRTCYLVIIII